MNDPKATIAVRTENVTIRHKLNQNQYLIAIGRDDQWHGIHITPEQLNELRDSLNHMLDAHEVGPMSEAIDLNTEVWYSHQRPDEPHPDARMWIGVTVKNVPQEHKDAIETILEQARDDLVELLGLG